MLYMPGWNTMCTHNIILCVFSVEFFIYLVSLTHMISHEQCSRDRFTHGPKSQVSTLTWMLIWQHFLEVRLATCVESWVEQKAKPNSWDLKLKSWFFASMLGLGNMNGTWDLGPHVNQPFMDRESYYFWSVALAQRDFATSRDYMCLCYKSVTYQTQMELWNFIYSLQYMVVKCKYDNCTSTLPQWTGKKSCDTLHWSLW
jgi:hypothetical protein